MASVPPELNINHTKFSPRRYLRSGLDLNVVSDGDYVTPLEIALFDRDWPTARAMLRAGARPRNTPPIRPTGVGQYMDDVPVSILRELVACGLEVDIPNSAGYRPLQFAAASSHPRVLSALLELGADPNIPDWRGYTAVHLWAEAIVWRFEPAHVWAAHRQRLRLLLRAGADINAVGVDGTPVQLAVMLYMLNVMYSVGKHPWDPNGHARTAIYLLSCGASPAGSIPRPPKRRSMRVPDGAPLLMAWPVGNGSLHRALMRAGASPHQPASNGMTPLEFAERRLARIDARSSGESATQDCPEQLRRVIALMKSFPLPADRPAYTHSR